MKHQNKFSFLLYLLIPGLFLNACAPSEEKINFDINTVEAMSDFENGLSSTLKIQDGFRPAKGFFPLDSIYQIEGRYVYQRPNENFLPLTTKYYLDEKTDNILFTIYEWNRATPGIEAQERAELLLKEAGKFDDYHAKYVELVKRFQKRYGKPIEGDGRAKKSLHVLGVWKAHLKFQHNGKYIDLDWIWIPSNDARVFKIIAKAYPAP